MEVDGGVLVLRRIRVRYRVVAGAEHREIVERVHGIHKEKCPVYRSIHPSIDVTTSYEMVEG